MSEDHKRMRKIIEENGHLPNDTIARIVQKETRRVHSSEEIASYRLDHKTAAERPQADRYQSGRTRARASLIALATITALGVGATAIDYMKSSAAPKSTARDYVTPEEMVFLDARGTLYKPTSLDITDLRSSGMLPDLIKMYEAQHYNCNSICLQNQNQISI